MSYVIIFAGGTASGKTTIANIFALFNIPVFDADREIKKILTNKEVKQKLKNIWPLVIKKDQVDQRKINKIE